MKAVTWQGVEDVRVDDVPHPRIEQPTEPEQIPVSLVEPAEEPIYDRLAARAVR